MDYSKNFCVNLVYWMKVRGLTQKDIMVDLGIPSSTMSNWCTGQRVPKMSKVKMLADYLRVDVGDLLEDRSQMRVNREFSREVASIAEMYSRLDEHGKDLVYTILKSELERCEGLR